MLDPERSKTVGEDRFRRQVRVARPLDHPHILRVLDSGQVEDLLWSTVPNVTCAVGAAPAAAREQGVVHRDLEPDNNLLKGDQVMVADFGVARAGGEVDIDGRTNQGAPTWEAPTTASPRRGWPGRILGTRMPS